MHPSVCVCVCVCVCVNKCGGREEVRTKKTIFAGTNSIEDHSAEQHLQLLPKHTSNQMAKAARGCLSVCYSLTYMNFHSQTLTPSISYVSHQYIVWRMTDLWTEQIIPNSATCAPEFG